MQQRCVILGLSAALVLLGVTRPVRAADSAWRRVDTVPVDLPPELMFDPVRPVDAFEEGALGWRAERGDQFTQASVSRDSAERHGGAAALRVDYTFAGKAGLEYLQVSGPSAPIEREEGLGFWFKGDGTPFVLRLRWTDTSGEWHQVDAIHHGRPGWQYVVARADAQSQAWGGDGNRRKDYPLKLAGIVIDRPRAGYRGHGSLWIDEVSTVKARPPETHALEVETVNQRFGNVYAAGETVALRMKGTAERVRWRVSDFLGAEIAAGEGAAQGAEARFTLADPGWFSCAIELVSKGRVVVTRSFPCAVLPGGAIARRSDFVGMCTHFGQGSYPLECMELMRRFGLDQFRDEVSWGSYETQPARLAMPDYATKYLDHARAVGMRPLLIFDYANRHYDNGGYPNSPEAIAAFARYAVDLARQTRGMVSMFEVWNEWIGGCGMTGKPGVHDGAAYGRLLKPVYAAVKGAFPDLTVIGIGGEYGPKCAEHILEAISTAGPDAMDGWSIHPYRYPRPPESSGLLDEVTNIAARVAAAGVRSRAWITEIGYPTHRTSGGSDLSAQARHTVRTLALLQSTPVVEKVFWYDLKDDGLSRDYNEHNFGLIHHQSFNCAPKPAMVAVATFVRLTTGAAPQGLTRRGNVWSVAYRHPDGAEVVLAWTTEGTARTEWAGTVKQAFDLVGRALPPSSSVALSEYPVYLAGQGLKLANIR